MQKDFFAERLGSIGKHARANNNSLVYILWDNLVCLP